MQRRCERMDRIRPLFAGLVVLAVHVFATGSMLTLWLFVGKKRAAYKTCWMLQSFLEWMSGEGRFRRGREAGTETANAEGQ
jgi:hypothetical protein